MEMKTLYIKIFTCFTYPFHKCMPTNRLNAYNNALMGFPQRGKDLVTSNKEVVFGHILRCNRRAVALATRKRFMRVSATVWDIPQLVYDHKQGR